MTTTAAVAVCVLLTALALFQVLLALGVPIGQFAWGGQHRVLPVALRVGSVVSIAIYAFVAVVVADRADLVSTGMSDSFVHVATWAATGYFLLGIAVNLGSRSKPERVVMTPLCALLCLLCLTVVLPA